MNYGDIFESYTNGVNITDEEYEFILSEVVKKIKEGKVVDGWEQSLLNEDGRYTYDDETVDFYRHGWVKLQFIYKIDDAYYKSEVPYHDDYGCDWENLDEEVLPKVKTVEYPAYRWEEV